MLEQHIILQCALLIVLYLRQVFSECEIRRLANEDIFVANNNDNVLIQRDSQEKFNFLDDQIQLQFQIMIQQNEKIISTQFIESLNDELFADKWLCQLIQIAHKYYISCIISIYIDEEGNANQRIKDHIRLYIDVSEDEQCHQFYLEKDSKFIVFCDTNQNLQIYSVDLYNQTQIELSYEYNFRADIYCLSIQFHKIDFGQYLISYLQCPIWQILMYQDNEIFILADSKTQQPDSFISVKQKFNETLICGKQIALIEDDSVYVFSLTEQLNFLYSSTNQGYVIQNVIFSKSCVLEYITLIQKVDNRKFMYKKSQDIKDSLDQKALQTYSAFNFIFLLHYDKLQIALFGDQAYEIVCFPQSIVFIGQYNLFYIIDYQNKLISFFKINKLVHYLQPTKQYIYEIPKSYQRFQTSQCYQIIYDSIQTKSNIITYEFKNECQSKEEIIIKKDDYNFLAYQQFENIGEQQNTVKYIIENVYLNDVCPNIEQYTEENELLYYRSNSLENYAILKSNDTLQVLFCNNQSTIQQDITHYQVFQFQDAILLIKKKAESAKVIFYSIGLNQQHQIQINSQIIEILQFRQYVILMTEYQEDILFLDLLLIRQKQISKKLSNILNQFIIESTESAKIKFYFAQFLYFQIYQINKLLVIEQGYIVNLYKINDITIIYTGESIKLSNNQILPNKYCVIGIHNKDNIIKQYILDDSLKLFENHQIDDYDFIRPIQFDSSKEYLIIAMSQQDQNYLFIFKILQPLKLIKVIKISKLKFHLQNHLVYYYNKDLEVQIFNIEYFQISYINLAEKQKQIVLHEKIPIQLKYQEEEDSPNQLFLDLKVNNYCRNLISQQNEQIIYVNEEDTIRIEDIDMFNGPIDQIILINNRKLQLEGPFLQQQDIEECINQQQVCFTKMEIGYALDDEQSTLFYSLRYYNKYKILPFYSHKDLKDSEKIIKDAYIFKNSQVLYFYVIDKMVFANVLQFNKTQLAQQYDPIILYGFNKEDIDQAQFFYSNNLILIKSNSSEKLIKISQTQQINEIELNFGLTNILFIENSDNQYIEIKIIKKLDQYYFLFNIFQLRNSNFLYKDSFKIFYDKIESALSPHIYIDIYQLQEYFKNQLLESVLIENQIEIKVLQLALSFSVISKITINLNKRDIIYDIQNILRHPKSQELLNFQYYDRSILILTNSIMKKSFLYDLRQIKPFYDYILKIDDNMLKLYPLNTTHYLFYFNEINKFIIGEIGFEIKRLEDLNHVETCIIKASNQVSQSEFTLIIKRLTFLSKEAKIVTTSAILLGSFYLLRRNKLKQQQEIQNQISLNSSIISQNNE